MAACLPLESIRRINFSQGDAKVRKVRYRRSHVRAWRSVIGDSSLPGRPLLSFLPSGRTRPVPGATPLITVSSELGPFFTMYVQRNWAKRASSLHRDGYLELVGLSMAADTCRHARHSFPIGWRAAHGAVASVLARLGSSPRQEMPSSWRGGGYYNCKPIRAAEDWTRLDKTRQAWTRLVRQDWSSLGQDSTRLDKILTRLDKT